jgi:peptidoglycan/LPS O-acetylase OafA/YrhL
MLWGIALILVVVWALGLATASTLTGAVQVLAVVAAALLLMRVVKRHRRRQRR